MGEHYIPDGRSVSHLKTQYLYQSTESLTQPTLHSTPGVGNSTVLLNLNESDIPLDIPPFF